ncbi:MAG: sel1 repeat family protein [Gammaproteobacteria bacterium]|nr:sel1 repeat family protein [Gammaproteobacteria bacterium]
MAADPPDWDAARAAFHEAADAGSPTAMAHLGWIYEKGHGVAADGDEAAAWYGHAARAGAYDYAMKLGWMYLGGQNVAQDRARAEAWFEFGVDAGHTPTQVAWASVLISDALGGRSPERVFEARTLLESALNEGYGLASFFLARLYMEGIGGHPVDLQQAAKYTRIGAADGHAQMQGWLAVMYLRGQGVEADVVQAAKWANLAAAGGDAAGNDLRLALEAQLDPEQIQAARQRAVHWALERD